MTYTHNLSFFSVLVFGIIIEPGMDMFFVIANALTGGRARGSGGGGVYDSTGGCGVIRFCIKGPGGMKKLNLRLPDVQHDRLKTLASQRGRSFSKLSGEFSLKALAEFDTEDRFRISASRGNRVKGLAVPDVPDRKRGKHRKDEARLGAKLQNYRRIGFRTDRENGACCEALLAGGLSVLSDIFVH